MTGAMAEKRSRLGRGLAALIGDVGDEAQVLERQRNQRRVPIEFVKPNPRNPRRAFADAELDELAHRSASAASSSRSWCAPCAARWINTRSSPASGAGARRSARACTTCRCCCSKSSDRESLELAIIENVQRADLNPLEEANGYQSLAEEFNYSQDEIAKIVGKSRPHVANTLRLLKLSDAVKAYINSGQLSAGHARALVGQADPEDRARHRQAGPQCAAGRGDGAGNRAVREKAQGSRAGATRRQYRRGGKAAVGHARPCGQYRPPRRGRGYSSHSLSHAGAARRHHPASGKTARTVKSIHFFGRTEEIFSSSVGWPLQRSLARVGRSFPPSPARAASAKRPR